MKWGLWSTTAASNSATPPDGWPEGQAPSTVNDCAREMMAAIATGLQDIQFVDLGFAPTQTAGNTFTVSGTHADVLHYGRKIKASDGAVTLYGTIYSSTATSNTLVAVRFDSGGQFDSSLSSFAIGSPGQVNGALPDIAYRDFNFLDNACFDVNQRGFFSWSASAASSVVNYADRWATNLSHQTAGATIVSSFSPRSAAASNVPTVAQCGILLNRSYCISVNNAIVSPNIGDFLVLQQNVEGYNFKQIAQKPMSLSFWVNSNRTGTYCVRMLNGGADRSCIIEYQISAPSTWERKTLTFPKSPDAGTWDYSSGIGLSVQLVLQATQTGMAGNWTATNVLATVSQVNFLSSAGNTIRFAAMKLQEGPQATPLRPIHPSDDIKNCQRYLYVAVPQAGQFMTLGYGVASGLGSTSAVGRIVINMPTTMRAAPTLSQVGAGNLVLNDANSPGTASVSVANTSGDSTRWVNNAGLVAGNSLIGGRATALLLSSGTTCVFKSEI